MSKQYLTTHTVDDAHKTDIFALAATNNALISASGTNLIHIHDTTSPTFPLLQTLETPHKLGVHHIATSKTGPGRLFASAGFDGQICIWRCTSNDSQQDPDGTWDLSTTLEESGAWAMALSEDEQFLACSTHDGRIVVWDLLENAVVRTYNTATGNFAMAVDLSRDGRLTASGHQSGSVYVFNNDTGRLVFTLSGLAKSCRAVAFSPHGTLLAAAGDAGVIALYDMQKGEHVGNLSLGSSSAAAPSPAWILSLDFSETGEYLLSGSMDGRARVWSIERQACVATHSETDEKLWAVKWLPRGVRGKGGEIQARGERFCAAGGNKSITFYREASGI